MLEVEVRLLLACDSGRLMLACDIGVMAPLVTLAVAGDGCDDLPGRLFSRAVEDAGGEGWSWLDLLGATGVLRPLLFGVAAELEFEDRLVDWLRIPSADEESEDCDNDVRPWFLRLCG